MQLESVRTSTARIHIAKHAGMERRPSYWMRLKTQTMTRNAKQIEGSGYAGRSENESKDEDVFSLQIIPTWNEIFTFEKMAAGS